MAFDGFPLSPYGRHLWAYEWNEINLEYLESAEKLKKASFFFRMKCICVKCDEIYLYTLHNISR